MVKMRTLKLSAMAIAVLCLAACSESVTEVAPQPVEPQPDLLAADTLAEGYLGFGLQLPTAANSGTRANDEFSDGDTDKLEYAVNTGVLVLFQGAAGGDEGDATFCGAYDLENENALSGFSENTAEQCTTHATVVKKIDNTKLTTGNELYAYVILNHHLMFTNISPSGLTVSASDGDKTVSKLTKFSQFKEYTLAAIGEKTLGFVMTNAPVSSHAGGNTKPDGAKITTLARLDKTKIKSTEAEARTDVTGDIFVERAAVKVTVNVGSSIDGTKFADGTTTTKFSTTDIKWAIGNQNSIYYNTRKYKDGWVNWDSNGTPEGTPNYPYRFISKDAIHTETDYKVGYRTYWAEDVNYDTNPTLTAATTIDLATGTNAYTWENTMDVDRMTFRNTTYVALKVKFNDGKPFFTSPYTGNKVILQPTWDDSDEDATTIDCIPEVIHEYLMHNHLAYKQYCTDNSKGAKDLTVKFSATSPYLPSTPGYATITDIAGDAISAGVVVPPVTVAMINAAIKFKYYDSGLTYYNVRLKHFGAQESSTSSCETPWDVTKHGTNSVTGAYKQYIESGTTNNYTAAQTDNFFTGRYGVVRNNWYQLEILGISAIGAPKPIDPNETPDPEDPDPDNPGPDTPDDEVESYVGVKIHVLPWALRKQGAVL